MTPVRLLARPLLSAAFVSGGVDTLRNPGPRVQAAEAVVDAVAEPLGLPEDPELLTKVNAGVMIGAGVLLAAGKVPRLSSLALAATIVPTTLAEHRFWEMDDEGDRSTHQQHFLKNLGLLGGLALAAVDTEGQPGLAWRAKHAGQATRRSARRTARTAKRETGAAAKVASREARMAGERAARRGKRARRRVAGVLPG